MCRRSLTIDLYKALMILSHTYIHVDNRSVESLNTSCTMNGQMLKHNLVPVPSQAYIVYMLITICRF